MSSFKNVFILGLVLVSAFILNANAKPEPEPKPIPAKNLQRSAYFNEQTNSKFRSIPLPDENDEPLEAEFRQGDGEGEEEAEAAEAAAEVNEGEATPSKGDASTGRLFLKKFLLFKNIFGSNSNSQPVIPIIITGAGTGTSAGTAAPTTTITSTGSIPTATGTITTSPASPTATTATSRRSQEEEDAEGVAKPSKETIDVQALQAALAAGAQEYVVTDQEIRGTSDSKASKQTDNIKLRRKGAKKGQIVQVRVPPKYRRYFKNGQKVMLNTKKRGGGKRRVVRKRVNKNRRRVGNKNKKNRRVPMA